MKREGEGGKEGEKGEGGSDDARTFWLLLASTIFLFILCSLTFAHPFSTDKDKEKKQVREH